MSLGQQKTENRTKIKRPSLVGGEVFGRLVVDSFSHSLVRRNDGGIGERVMNCVCSCGNKVKVRTSNLYSGNTSSCGCLHSARVIESNMNRTPPAYFSEAKNRIEHKALAEKAKAALAYLRSGDETRARAQLVELCSICGVAV